jgi:NADH:ubiquinone oxidoreductase subunit F (NADH-binding)
VVVAIKQRFRREAERLRGAATEIQRAGWSRVIVDIVEGPDEYLYGEETALLEVIEGRLPFPRLAPPWRQGVDSQPEGSAAPAEAVLAASDGGPQPPPALVNNVETFAHVALIGEHGAEWFRVCTLSGATGVAGVIEVPTGTTLRQVIDAVGDDDATEAVYALPGVANPILPAAHFDGPLGYDELRDAGSGLGTAGFILFDERVDPVSVALGVARFLGVESCGQCTPCKQDGLAIAQSLTRVQIGGSTLDRELPKLSDHLATITDGARCYLATQHHDVVTSLLRLLDPSARAASPGDAAPYPIVEIVDLVEDDDGTVVHLDEGHLRKQPDWSYDDEDSGQAPAERFDQDLALP